MSLLACHSSVADGFTIPQKAKTLLQILVEELPKHGGWPEGVVEIGQDYDRELMFYGLGLGRSGIRPDSLSPEHRKLGKYNDEIGGGTTITRDHYETALAFVRSHEGEMINNLQVVDGYLKCEFTPSAPVERISVNLTMDNADGWIDWAGGECPVDQEEIINIRHRDGCEEEFVEAGKFRWTHIGWNGDIIAYRLNQPQEAEQEADLNECIGQPQPSKDDLISDFLMDMVANDVNMPLREAYELADTLITLGYRKQ